MGFTCRRVAVLNQNGDKKQVVANEARLTQTKDNPR